MKNYHIPIFVPHEGCPFSCVFCNQERITGVDTSITANDIKRIIEEHLKTIPKDDRYVEAAFFGGSFTGISADKQDEFLATAYEYVKDGRIDGIRLSTRPDYIDETVIKRLKKYGVTTVELGVQSMDNEVLDACMRGHDSDAVINAAGLIKKSGIKLGLQMMTGLPQDTDEKAIETAKKIIALQPDCVRIYPTLVIRDTVLYEMYKNGEYLPQNLEDAVNLCKRLILMFEENNIDIIRVSLVTTDEICENGAVMAGPFHSSFRELTEGEIYFDRFCEILDKDKSVKRITVNSREISKAVGHKRRNIERIKEIYNINIKIDASSDIEKGKIKVWKE